MRLAAPAFVCLVAAGGVLAQQAERNRPVLEIPESIDIAGRASYQQVTEGEKVFVYFGMAFPVERTADQEGPGPGEPLPTLTSKELYPMLVRHGGARATSVEGMAQNYGNGLIGARHVADIRGWLGSADAELGGGAGHVDGADWHREMVSGRAQRAATWRTTYDGSVLVESGRTGVWGVEALSHRTYYGIGGGAGLDHAFAGDHEVRLGVDLRQRDVGDPRMNVSEQSLTSDLTWQNASGRFWLKGDVLADLVHTSRDSGTAGTSSAVAVSAEAWTRPEENFGGALGVTIYSAKYLGGDSLRTIRPSVTAWARLFNTVKFSARLTSGLERFGIWEAYQQQPMLSLDTPLRMAFHSVDIDVNGEAPIRHAHLMNIGLREQVIRDYPVWKRQAAGEPFVADYGYAMGQTASIASFYGRYRYTWSSGSSDVLAIWRKHSLVGQRVPYVPDWEVHATTGVPLWRGITISPTAQVIGPRAAVRPVATLDRLGAYAVLDLEAAYPLRGGWLLTGSLFNLLNQNYERWQGVREPGFHVQLGAKRTW